MKSQEIVKTYVGQIVKTHAFGNALVKKIYPHRETGEYVADVAGKDCHMHLSLAYLSTLKVVG